MKTPTFITERLTCVNKTVNCPHKKLVGHKLREGYTVICERDSYCTAQVKAMVKVLPP